MQIRAVSHRRMFPTIGFKDKMMKIKTAGENIEIVPFSELDRKKETAWIDLVNANSFNPTLNPGWLRVILDSWEIDCGKVQVFIHSEGSRMIGVIPHMVEVQRRAGLPLKAVSTTSGLVSYHAEILSDKDAGKTLGIFLENIHGWDRFFLTNIIDDGPTAKAVRKICSERGWRVLESEVDISPYLPLEGTFEELLASKKKKFRYKHRKRNELLAASEELRMSWYRDVEHAEDFFKAFVQVEANSWKAKSRVDVSESNREGRYYSRLLPFLAENNALLGIVLSRGDQPIAYSLCCHWGDWMGHLKTGFDRRFDDLSPGALVIDASLSAAFDAGAGEFDFLGTPGKKQAEPHKLHWTKKARHHVSFEIFSDKLFPRIFGSLKEKKDRLSK